MPRVNIEQVQPMGAEDAPTKREFVETQRLVADFIDQLYAICPVLDGVLLEDQELAGSSANNLIQHGLGRDYSGFLIVRKSVTGSAIGDFRAEADPETTLVLRTANAQTVSVWVF